jgi:hypothetical protein
MRQAGMRGHSCIRYSVSYLFLLDHACIPPQIATPDLNTRPRDAVKRGTMNRPGSGNLQSSVANPTTDHC